MYIGIAIGFVIGFFVAFFTRKHFTSAPWSSERAKELSEKGRVAIAARIVRRKDRIVKFAQEKGVVCIDDAEDLFCISDDTASKYLHELVGEKRLRKISSNNGTCYEAVDVQ